LESCEEKEKRGWRIRRRTTKVMKCEYTHKKERRLVVGELVGSLAWFSWENRFCVLMCSFLSADAGNQLTKVPRGGGPGLTFSGMYKTPGGVQKSVAHHLKHPHNEGG
jgi:hypothetical protein